MWAFAAFAFGVLVGWLLTSINGQIHAIETDMRADDTRAKIADLEVRIADAVDILNGKALAIHPDTSDFGDDFERNAPDIS